MQRYLDRISLFYHAYRRPLEWIFFFLLLFPLIRHLQTFQTNEWSALLEGQFSSPALWYLLLAVLLMPLNWILEAWKWKLILRRKDISFLHTVKGTLAGLAFGLITPWRSGELPGRSAFIGQQQQKHVLPLTLWAGAAQTLATLLAMLLAMPLLNTPDALPAVLLGLSSFLLLLYFYPIPFIRMAGISLPPVTDLPGPALLSVILGLSLIRLCVYAVQYLLLFYFTGITESVLTLLVCTLQFLFAASFSPLMPLLDPAWRGTAVMFIFPEQQHLQAMVAVGCIWLINLILPAFAGYTFWVKRK